MDLYESLKKIKDNDNQNTVDKYKESAISYAEQGFDEQQIEELLQINGCPIDASKEMSKAIQEDLPKDYSNGPPVSYIDIKDKVEESIKNASVEDLSNYILKTSSKGKDILKEIIHYRDNPTRQILAQVHDSLEPVLENSLLMNKTASEIKGISDTKLSIKDKLGYKLFGIWPVHLIESYNRKMEAEKKIEKRSGNKKGGAPIIFF
jgi:hypothetical protein